MIRVSHKFLAASVCGMACHAMVAAAFCCASAATADTIAHYTFDDWKGANDEAQDVSGNGRTLKFVKSASTGENRPDKGLTKGASAALKRDACYGEIQNAAALAINDKARHRLTLECWVKPASLGSDATLINLGQRRQGDSTGSNPTFVINLGLLKGGIPQAAFYHGREWHKIQADKPLAKDEWTHLALVFKEGEMRLLVNGRNAAEKNTQQPLPETIDYGIIGGAALLGQFKGLIDDVRISNDALPPAKLLR